MTTSNKASVDNLRPSIQRTACFGDYVLKKQRALDVIGNFCKLQSGKLFETENVIKGCFGVSASEMMKRGTFSNRLLPLIFERDLFVNLPEDLSLFVGNLFETVLDARFECTEISKLSAKFAKYTFDLMHLCFVKGADYEYRRQNEQEIEADFDGMGWVLMISELKNECIRYGHSELFQPFDPSSNALFGCLWDEDEPVTLFEIELRLHAGMYCSDERVQRDLKTVFAHLERIFCYRESIRTFVAEKLKKLWMNGPAVEKKDSLDVESVEGFETDAECLLFFEKAKNEKQREQNGQLRVNEIMNDRVIRTRLEGDACFYQVRYVEFPNEPVWESRVFMLRNYRNEIKKYIAKKKAMDLE